VSLGRGAAVLLVAASAVLAPERPARAAATATATATVDTFEDSFDGSCADGDCSLRDAIADVDPGGTVRVPAGFYPLTRSGTGAVGEGDLDIDRRLTLVGVGETGAFLDGSGLGDRVLDVTAGVRLRHLTLLGGASVPDGGIVRVNADTTRMTFVTLVGGRATDGGAVAVGDGAAVRIDRSWVSASRASERGGALFVRGTASVVRSTVSGNHAGAGGGAWVGPVGQLTVDDSTVSGNVADRGGGGMRVRGHATLSSTTAVRNRATVGGAVMASATVSVRFRSSLVGRNEATSRGPSCSRRVSTGGHNVADAAGCGLRGVGDRLVGDVRLGGLRQNGGPTPTHAIRSDSAAVGNGAGCDDVDQRGAPRRECDSGAYELVSCLGRPVTIVGTPGPDDLSGGLQPDVFLGRGGDDVFQGSIDRDRACGGGGDDVLIGGPDPDLLAGNGGNDRLLGEGGDDVMIGGPGLDVCRGGPGLDDARRCERSPQHPPTRYPAGTST
jgi:CSLREA domain-containing protein